MTPFDFDVVTGPSGKRPPEDARANRREPSDALPTGRAPSRSAPPSP